MYRITTINVHICTVTVALMHLCTILHPLMWLFFLSNYVKLDTFCILQNFTIVDMVTVIKEAINMTG